MSFPIIVVLSIVGVFLLAFLIFFFTTKRQEKIETQSAITEVEKLQIDMKDASADNKQSRTEFPSTMISPPPPKVEKKPAPEPDFKIETVSARYDETEAPRDFSVPEEKKRG